MHIPFNKPYLTGRETDFIVDAVEKEERISGNGRYTHLCQDFFQTKYGFRKCLLTTSCTDALEMAAILSEIEPGDEVIVPSFTFVSTANAFVLRGAKIVFADVEEIIPNIDVNKIEKLITNKTKAIVVVHYAGIACDMDAIMRISKNNKLLVIEDAAQSVDSYYKGKPLGSIGDFATFSFHETKNVISGEGGLLVINNEKYLERAEIIWEKGTNRAAFNRKEVNKYQWVDVGSSFLPSDIIGAFLYAQLLELENIQQLRLSAWTKYYMKLRTIVENKSIILPEIPSYATNNAHMFYVLCENNEIRDKLLVHLNNNNVNAVFHYLPLHLSPYYINKHDGRILCNVERYSDCIVRLPFFNEITDAQIAKVVAEIETFYNNI